jgi:HAD superfamily hydrolase (TIGR01484 family)
VTPLCVQERGRLRYFALACDYDGTLAKDGVVDDATLSTLKQVASTGRRLLLITGRALDDIIAIFPAISLFDLVVAENGAVLYRPATKEARELSAPVPAEFVEELARRHIEPLKTGRVIVATREPNETSVVETIREFGLDLQVIFNKGAVMVLPAGVNKATGLKAALHDLSISPHNVAGIGDAENDHAFLAICEVSGAVSNALPVVKERADFVAARDHGAGVREFAEKLLEDDLARLSAHATRLDLALGADERGAEVRLPPHGRNILLAGTSGAGKSTLAKVFLERLAERGYQFCIIDPEGDYEDFEEGVVFGSEKQPPLKREVMSLLSEPSQNAVVNLLGLTLEDRPAFFAKVMTPLLEMRARTGRPHWLIIDEAHHLMPAGWQPESLALPQELFGLLLITVHPDLVSPPALSLIDTIVTVGETPSETVKAFATRLSEKAPLVPGGALPSGEALLWSRRQPQRTTRFRIAETRRQHLRHRRKYAEGDLGPHSFVFRGPAGSLNLRAQNLFLFLQMAEGVDEETWRFHLQRGDYARWIREAIKNDGLALEVEVIGRAPLTQREGIARLRDAVERYYTLPAPHKATAEAPRSAATNKVSRRRIAARSDKETDPRRKVMDPVALLKQDHMKVKALFDQFERMKDNADEMKRITQQALMELQVHDLIEKELFYPALRMGRESTEEILDEAEEEHHVVEVLMEELLKMRNKDGKYTAKFTVLAENVKHHIAEEEGEMLPKAQQVLGARYMELGDQMMERKQQLMSQLKGRPKAGLISGGGRSGTRKTGARSTTRSRATSRSGTRSTPRSGARASASRPGARASGPPTGTRSRSGTRASSGRSSRPASGRSSSGRSRTPSK